VTDERVKVERWWNYTDRGQQQYWERNVAEKLCPTQRPRTLAWVQKQTSAVRGRRLPEPLHGLWCHVNRVATYRVYFFAVLSTAALKEYPVICRIFLVQSRDSVFWETVNKLSV